MGKVDMGLIKELRAKTEAGMSDCKEALVASEGDLKKAVLWLREHGQSIATKKSSRAIKEGLIHAYIHPPGKLGVLVEIGCESDFVAKNEAFIELANDIAMHIAAAVPRFIAREEVNEEILAQERELYRTLALKEGKPEQIVDKIVEGKLRKFYEEACLLEQPFVKEPDKTVQDRITETIAKLKENITVNRFVRFLVGEEA